MDFGRIFRKKKFQGHCKGQAQNPAHLRPRKLFPGNDGNDKNRHCKSDFKIHED